MLMFKGSCLQYFWSHPNSMIVTTCAMWSSFKTKWWERAPVFLDWSYVSSVIYV